MKRILTPISREEARMKNSLVLAYIGDTVYDLYYRSLAIKNSESHVNKLNKEVSAKVNAKAQSCAVEYIINALSEDETEIFKRGRNAKSQTSPKNMLIGDYRRATGLEAVIGYLWLTGEYERIDELMDIITEEDNG